MSEWKEYTREIDLIEKQNNVEYDLYSVIAPVLKRRKELKKYSIRDVAHRRRTKNQSERMFWGVKGFPDFVILNNSYNSNNPDNRPIIYGVVEVKYVNKPLDDEDDILQLKGHMMSFGKVIFTNGYVWRIYNNKFFNKKNIEQLEDESYLLKMTDKESWENIDLQISNNTLLKGIKPKVFVLKENKESSWNKNAWDSLIKELDEFK